MFEALAEAIEELDIPPVGDAIAEVIGLRDRLDAAICDAVGKFDADGGWEIEGATSIQVAAIVANLSPKTTPLFAEHEAALLPTLVPLREGPGPGYAGVASSGGAGRRRSGS